MSRQAQQRARLSLYRELSEIVGAMKNMAEVELHRIARTEANQKQALSTAREAIALLLQAAPNAAAHIVPQRRVLLVLGSERGFCGGFNEQLVRALAKEQGAYDKLLIMGGRLVNKLGEGSGRTCFPGPTTVDELLPRMQQLMDHLSQLRDLFSLNVLSHAEQTVEKNQLLPSQDIPDVAGVVHVDVSCKAKLLFEELQWQCLYQNLFRAMLISLQWENRMRLQQMEGAREHLETLITHLHLRLNTLRQQEIVEEIEMILVGQDAGCTDLEED